MTKFKPPSPPFIGARYHGGSQIPKAIVIHGTVTSDNKGTARNVANWWHGPTSPVTSAHYVVDPGETIQCVGDHTIAYHVGYNTGSIAIELCDEQVGPATRWADADSEAILRRAARLAARLSLAYGIAVVRPTISDLKAKGPHGIYGHNDSRLAFGYTSHTDPRDFPWTKFMRMVRVEVKHLKAEANTPTVPPQPPTVPPKTPKPSVRVHVNHASMQFSDNATQMQSDADKIFARAKERGVRWITGTEAGHSTLRNALSAAAKANGYRIYIKGDCWIAVARSQLKKGGSWTPTWRKSVDGIAKRWTDKGVVAITFDTVDIGRVTVIAAHYLTKGRPGTTGKYAQNVALNQKIAEGIGAFAREAGKGSALVFFGGDQNIVDRYSDTFFGEPLTSLWDELGKYENTGHGNIDVIASYDADGRVVGVYCRALNDREFPLATDHYLLEGGYDVRLL